MNVVNALDLVFYAILIVCEIYCFTLFVIWWIKIKKVSYVYKLLAFLLIGLFFNDLGGLLVLSQHYVGDTQDAIEMVNNWIWPFTRAVPVIVLILFTIHMTWRFKHMDRKGRVNYGRRITDK